SLAIPWVFYGYALSLVEGRPTKSSALPCHNEVRQSRMTKEKLLKQNGLAGIAPYWFYDSTRVGRLVRGYSIPHTLAFQRTFGGRKGAQMTDQLHLAQVTIGG